jgi:hypothetical protein
MDEIRGYRKAKKCGEAQKNTKTDWWLGIIGIAVG